MVCKKCGAELADDSIYCLQCGARVDGKKKCLHCGRDIPEEAVFCSYCGARADGKTVCKDCGTAFEGSFCPRCGKKITAAAETYMMPHEKLKKAEQERQAAKSKAYNVMSVVKQSLLFAALCIMFVCSFFISFSLVYSERGAEQLSSSTGATSFYFLVDSFKEVKDLLAQTGTYYREFEIANYLLAGSLCAIVATIIIVCAVYFALGTVAFVRGMRGKKEFTMSKYVVTPAAVFLGLLILLKSFMSVEAGSGSAEVSLRLGTVSILNVVFVSVFLAGAAVLHIITHPKDAGKNIMNYVMNGICAALVFISFLTLAGNMIKSVTIGSSVTESVNAGASAPLLAIGILSAIGLTEAPEDIMYTIMNKSLAAFAVYLIIFVLLIIMMAVFARRLTGAKKGGMLNMVFSCIAAALSLAYLILTLSVLEDTVVGSVGGSPICALVFSLLLLGTAIAACILTRDKKSENTAAE